VARSAFRNLQGSFQQRFVRRFGFGALIVAAACLTPRPASGYSVLAHESNIDALWASHIRPLLRERYPQASAAQLDEARAYAYGGSVVLDLGYFPFGSHFFTNLLHYVRTGDFIETMLRDAGNANEYAFALGSLSHYASDAEGHAIAINHAIPLMYPKLRTKFGDDVPYDKAPKEHLLVEFAFDVLLVAHGGYKLQAYHDFIGFEVATPLLERAFRDTYGLEMKDLFFSEDLAVGTFRHAVAKTIPNVTKIAWEKKQDQIQQTTPGAIRERFVLSLPRVEYEKKYGTDYKKPHGVVRVLGWLYVLVPKIGPLRPLAFKVPNPEAEKLFLDSLARTRERYRADLELEKAGRLTLPNINLDTGKAAVPGGYPLADQTIAELAKRGRNR
jgi:hypothetical protein